MANARSPPSVPLWGESGNEAEHKWFICEDIMDFDSQECYKISTCGHLFHRSCIEKSLSASSKCPTCQLSCELSNLRKYTPQPLISMENATQTETIRRTRPNIRGKARGAISRPQTRSLSRNLFNEHVNSSLDFSPRHSNPNGEVVDQFSPNSRGHHTTYQNVANNDTNTHSSGNNNADSNILLNNPPGTSASALNQAIGIDYNRIHQMIESSLSRMLQNVNLHSNPIPNHTSVQFPNRGNGQPPPTQPLPQNVNNNCHNVSFNHSEYPMSVRPEKITSMIRNWNIKIDGSNKGLTVDEFLYRIISMTKDHLNGNFDIVCGNLQVLLADKALHWYWRYHKQVDCIRWNEFCVALKCEFKDLRSNYDLKEEIRNRKMRPGELFETFYDSICTILDRLETPMVEAEIVEILTRNLRPDIRHELLYVPVYSIAHLRKLVQMRENLLADDIYRKQVSGKNAPIVPPFRRNVSEVIYKEELEQDSLIDQVDAVSHSAQTRFTCFNCKEPGHHWEDCTKERTIFCYGCGLENVYKPQCTKCSGDKSKFPKNCLRPKTPQNQP